MFLPRKKSAPDNIGLSYTTVVLCLCCWLLASVAAQARSVRFLESILHNKSLVERFYTLRNGSLVWAKATGGIDAELLSILRTVSSLGLDSSRYHFAQITKLVADPTSDTQLLRKYDRLCTDAMITLCKDVYSGHDIDDLISFDELSAKNTMIDIEHILSLLQQAKLSGNLAAVIQQLEPTDSTYRKLKAELTLQIAQGRRNKIKQLNTALSLHRWVHHFRFDRHIVVNVALPQLWYYEHDSVKLVSRVIVGKPKTKTPRFAAYCTEVIFYPYWNVPKSIAQKELFSKFKNNRGAIDAMNMQIIDKTGKPVNPRTINWGMYSKYNFPYNFRQCTGCENSLGVIKFNLTDPFSVYLHDTNNKKLFGSKSRFFSHGCIRVQEAVALANFLLNNTIDEGYLSSCLKDQTPVHKLPGHPIPVFIIYSPAAVSDSGTIVYGKDVYNLFH